MYETEEHAASILIPEYCHGNLQRSENLKRQALFIYRSYFERDKLGKYIRFHENET
jgi:hypothetical protein